MLPVQPKMIHPQSLTFSKWETVNATKHYRSTTGFDYRVFPFQIFSYRHTYKSVALQWTPMALYNGIHFNILFLEILACLTGYLK